MEQLQSTIQALSEETINQISAGEVIERPSQLLKELIENSIDAGAKTVRIEARIADNYFRVLDDGRGMSAQDIERSVLRHTTSKILSAVDLYTSLSSFGFRGEALSSIASVSKMTISSRRASAPFGHKLAIDCGALSPLIEVQCSFGCDIIVEDLFVNMPARKKFLKSATAELVQIKNVIRAIACAYPDIQFHFFESDRLQLSFAKQSWKERAQAVLGLQNASFVDSKFESIRVRAVLSAPNQVQKTQRNIWILVNNRWVQDRTVQAAVLDAYKNTLMHGEFPQVVVAVDLPNSEVDVNVHPTKSQVKFSQSDVVFRSVRSALRSQLEKATWLQGEAPENITAAPMPIEIVDSLNSLTFDTRPHPVQYPSRSFVSDQQIKSQPIAKFEDPQRVRFWGGLHIIGQAHLTYVVAQSEKELYLIDQHAAHERVRFEELMESFRAKHFEVQRNLFPLTIDLSSEDAVEAICKKQSDIERVTGICFEQSGPTQLEIVSFPALIKESSICEVLVDLSVRLLKTSQDIQLTDFVGDLFATMACHSVVRAGQALSVEQMKSLLEDMDNYPLSSFCPHGRPVFIKLSLHQIEKEFGRS